MQVVWNGMIQGGARFFLSWLNPRTVFYVLLCITTIISYKLWALIEYLTDVWEQRITDAAAIVNVLDGLTATLSIGIAILTDAYFGGYSMALITSASFSIGLSLLTMSVPPTLSKILGSCKEQKAACIGKLQHSLFYIAAPAIAIGTAGYVNSLPTFWTEQFNTLANQDLRRTRHCTDTGWISISLLVIAISTYIIASIDSWQFAFGVLAVLMIIATLIFLCATPSYTRLKPRGSPLPCVMCVTAAASLKIHHQCPSNPSLLHNPEGAELPLPHTNHLRFLNKASVIVSQDADTAQNNWRLCTVTEVEETKRLLGMFPMWTTFLICGLVLSVGNTYFVEQGNKMETKLGKIHIPLVCLFLLSEFSRTITAKICERVLSSCAQIDQRCSPVLRIGTGMVVSTLCCAVAALVESKRLEVLRTNGLIDEPKVKVPMATVWLLPQFLLLGATDGLVRDGIKQFFNDNCPDSMKTYAEPFAQSAVGVGTILSPVNVTILNKVSKIGREHGWFAATLNRSRLDYFYWTLACLSFVNLSFYYFMSKKYTIKRGTVEQRVGLDAVVPVHETVVSVHPTIIPVHPDTIIMLKK